MEASASASTSTRHQEVPPLVIVQGFLSPASRWIWGPSFQDLFSQGEQAFRSRIPSSSTSDVFKRRKIIFAPLGPCSSLHDRACELFFALKGGRIDYGEEHSAKHGHSRFGRFYTESEALFPDFDADHPAHFVGHSLGGTTLSKLQQLLREGFFDRILNKKHGGWKFGENSASTNEEAILSITSVSSPFHGTPLVYLLGSEPVTYPSVRFFSLGNLLAKAVHVLAFIDGFAPTSIRNTTRNLLDVYSDAWHFAQSETMANEAEDQAGSSSAKERCHRRDIFGTWRGGRMLLQQLWKSDWAEGADCAPWECTLWERERDSKSNGWRTQPEEELHPQKTRKVQTWYRSYSSFMTSARDAPGTVSLQDPIESKWHRVSVKRTPTHLLLSPLAFTANLIGRYDYHQLDPLPTFLKDVTTYQDYSISTLSQASKALMREQETNSKKWGANGADSAYHSGPTSPSILSPRSRSPSPPSPFSSKAMSCCSSPTSASEFAAPSTTSDRFETPPLLESWFANDGIVPLASQYHPGPCSQETCTHSLGLPLSCQDPAASQIASSSVTENSGNTSMLQLITSTILRRLGLPATFSIPFTTPASTPTQHLPSQALPEPNHWQVIHLPETSHTSLAPVWTGSEKQKLFWIGLGEWIASVDEASGRVAT